MDDVAPDGTTIKSRLKTLVHQAAQDIKACSNACDIYSKKKLVGPCPSFPYLLSDDLESTLVKVLKSTSWNENLADFSRTFTTRRSEFKFALMIHTTRGVDAANEKLGDMDEKINMLLELFKKSFVPLEEKEMEKLIQRKGGAKACQEDDKILQELSEFKSGSSVSLGLQEGRRAGAKISSDLDDIKEDLRLEPAAAVEKNMEIFSRKFELQKKQIAEEMRSIAREERDRVISAVTAGPHDKIIDTASVSVHDFFIFIKDLKQDVRQLWKDMVPALLLPFLSFIRLLPGLATECRSASLCDKSTGSFP